nr:MULTISPECIES: cellulose biosynthesis protein BcsE [Pseudomonas]
MAKNILSSAIPGLDAEHGQFHEQGVYWLACDMAEDAAMVCRQVVNAMAEDAKAAFISDARGMREVLDALDPDLGPGEMALYEADRQAALHLAEDLSRIEASGRLVLAFLPAAVWEGGDIGQWCHEVRDRVRDTGAVLLVVSEGQSVWLVEQLRAHNQNLDGMAQLYRGQGGMRYLLHFWSNALGVVGTEDVELTHDAGGFALAGRPHSLGRTGGDELLCLAQRKVLEGAPAFSEHWQLFDSVSELGVRAGVAVSATVIFAMEGGQRLDILAQQLHTLRQLRGNALKLVVREMAPTLRYQDEQLLLACGASLIVPFGASLSRFLTQVDSIQGYAWRRRLPSDFEALLTRLRPLPVCGLVAPRVFAEAVQQMWQGRRNGEIVHQLLVLRPAPGLSPLQACSRSLFRRDGDIACIADGVLYLFLFACRAEGVEQALDYIFQLSWRELFIGQELLDDLGALEAPAFLDETVPESPSVESASMPLSQVRPALNPRRISLQQWEAA